METPESAITHLTEQERATALSRYRILAPFLEDGVPLKQIAEQNQLGLRTARRWVQQYRKHGLAGLSRKGRTDKGKRHIPPALQQLIELRSRVSNRLRSVSDPTTLIVVDEADRLKMTGLEQVRDIFDQGDIGLVLIGMPGLEKRLARYPQLYSRVGFVHEFRPLTATEVRRLLNDHWHPPEITLPRNALSDEEGVAAILRVTNGNFRLLQRLLTQIARVLQINKLWIVTSHVVDAARESLVIGAD